MQQWDTSEPTPQTKPEEWLFNKKIFRTFTITVYIREGGEGVWGGVSCGRVDVAYTENAHAQQGNYRVSSFFALFEAVIEQRVSET